MRKPIFAVLSLLIFFYSCTKIETNDIGNGLIPPIDGVNVKDTFFDVITNTFIDDEIAQIYKSDEHIIGTISNDPLFGTTSASLFLELKPTLYPFAFTGKKDSLVVDSAVLVLSYKGLYGDSTIPQSWKVYEMDNKLAYNRSYPADTTITPFSVIGSQTLDITRFNDSVNYGFENAKNQIRIKLDKSFATRIIKNYDSLNAYKTDSSFRDKFAGFAIVPSEPTGNALIRVSLFDTNTKLSLYYSTRVDASAKRDTTVSYFRFNSSGSVQTSASANTIHRNRAGAQVAKFLKTGKSDSLAFIQTSPGTFVTVAVPNLSKFRNALIHKAELTVYQAPFDPLTDGIFTAPRFVLLSAYDSTNRRKVNIPNDYEVTQGGANISSFGGFRDDRDLPGIGKVNVYFYSLTRYVQGIVTRHDSSYVMRLSASSNDSLYYKPPYPIVTNASPVYISPGNANVIANGRVRIYGGSGHSQQRMRLRIIYSEL